MAVYWNDKPYHSLDYELKQRFGEKAYKLSIDGGFTCPNRDGTLGRSGCIFCSKGGSGDFAAPARLSVSEQLNHAKPLIRQKHSGSKYIAYFQAYTNTYAPVSRLRSLYMEAAGQPDIAAIAIATRPDCLGSDVLRLLCELNHIKPVWVELGLQTMHERTARFIRRGYELSCFESALFRLKDAGLETVVHTIYGLPGESSEDMLATADYLSGLPIDGLKLQLLHILKGTDLADIYTAHPFHLLTLEEYTDLIIRTIERMPPHIVIHRITGDGPKALLIAPQWSGRKKQVLNYIHQSFKKRQTWQGRLYTKE